MPSSRRGKGSRSGDRVGEMEAKAETQAGAWPEPGQKRPAYGALKFQRKVAREKEAAGPDPDLLLKRGSLRSRHMGH